MTDIQRVMSTPEKNEGTLPSPSTRIPLPKVASLHSLFTVSPASNLTVSDPSMLTSSPSYSSTPTTKIPLPKISLSQSPSFSRAMSLSQEMEKSLSNDPPALQAASREDVLNKTMATLSHPHPHPPSVFSSKPSTLRATSESSAAGKGDPSPSHSSFAKSTSDLLTLHSLRSLSSNSSPTPMVMDRVKKMEQALPLATPMTCLKQLSRLSSPESDECLAETENNASSQLSSSPGTTFKNRLATVGTSEQDPLPASETSFTRSMTMEELGSMLGEESFQLLKESIESNLVKYAKESEKREPQNAQVLKEFISSNFSGSFKEAERRKQLLKSLNEPFSASGDNLLSMMKKAPNQPTSTLASSSSPVSRNRAYLSVIDDTLVSPTAAFAANVKDYLEDTLASFRVLDRTPPA